jgi:molybdopterin-guanine dinucleotide biosynthesis protein A
MGGGDKCLLPLMGKPMLAHVLDRIAPQCSDILINSNSEPKLLQDFRLPVAADSMPGFQGPLAGILTGMVWARRHHPHAGHILSVACDTPFLPRNLVPRLARGLTQSDAEIATATDGERSHPVIGLWPVALAERLEADLHAGVRALYRWLANFSVCETRFAPHHFLNINTPTDLQAAGATSAKRTISTTAQRPTGGKHDQNSLPGWSA